MGTKVNPSAFDCYAAAADDEPMFVLLGRDPLAPLLVSLWAGLRSQLCDSYIAREELLKQQEAARITAAMRIYAVSIGRTPLESIPQELVKCIAQLARCQAHALPPPSTIDNSLDLLKGRTAPVP